MPNSNRNLFRFFSLTLSFLVLFSSCSVYKPQEISYNDVNYKSKEVYLRFTDAPEYIYKLSDYSMDNGVLIAKLNSNFDKIESKKTVEIWKKEIGDLQNSDGKTLTINLKDIDKIEEYQYSRGGTVLQGVGVIFGIALIAGIIYLGTDNE